MTSDLICNASYAQLADHCLKAPVLRSGSCYLLWKLVCTRSNAQLLWVNCRRYFEPNSTDGQEPIGFDFEVSSCVILVACFGLKALQHVAGLACLTSSFGHHYWLAWALSCHHQISATTQSSFGCGRELSPQTTFYCWQASCTHSRDVSWAHRRLLGLCRELFMVFDREALLFSFGSEMRF